MTVTQQRGQMIPRGTNKWLLRIFRGRVEGKKQYASKMFTGTTAQARQALTAMLREEDTETFVPASKMTLADYLDRWLEGKIDVSSKTRASYTDQLKHVRAVLGLRKLTEIDTLSVQRLVSRMIEEELSPRSIEYTIRILRGALEDAVRSSTLARNPVTHVRLPPKVKRAASVLTMQQVGVLLEKTAESPMGPLWRLLLTTGMRPQEAFALMWSDVDFEGSWVSIRRTLVGDGHGSSSIEERTKAGSDRRIGLPESTVAALKVHKQRQSTEILKVGPHYDRQGLVFANRLGRPLDVARVRRWWKAALTASELPEIRLYDTRHTHLTALLQGGVDIAFVSARAGHKDISMTLQHYAHVLPESHREMGLVTERLLKDASK